MKVMLILMGLPRSGKTTLRNKLKRYTAISADDFRYLVYGKRFDSKCEPLMWSIREIALRNLMQQDKDIIIDECNNSVKRRKPLLRLAKEYNYETHILYVNTPLDICVERAIKIDDEEIIPTIESMNERFEEPIVNESSYIEGDVNFIYTVLCEMGLI